MNEQERLKAHIEMESAAQANRQRNSGDVGSSLGLSGITSNSSQSNHESAGSQLNDHGILREMEAMTDKFARGTPEHAVLTVAWKRLGTLMDECRRLGRAAEHANAMHQRANDRLRLVRCALNGD